MQLDSTIWQWGIDMFFSAKKMGFYTSEIHGENMPDDVVEITDEEHTELLEGQSLGKVIAADKDGRPFLQDQQPIPPLTIAQVEALRLKAYADPVTGSDRYFAEAARMNAMGEAGADAVTAAGVARYEEIQAEYPWP